MRAFLIKYYFGRYWWKFPKGVHYWSTSRAAFWNFNGYLLLALIFILSGGQAEWVIGYPTIIYSLWVLYISFPLGGLAYFERNIPKWEELDEEQKWMYGQAVMSGELTKKLHLTQEQMIQWIVLSNKFRNKYNLK